MKTIVVASNNKGKIAELKEILKNDFTVLSLNDIGLKIDVDETGKTFFENALLKAEAVYKLSGYATLSDDSGLCVDALNGEPGVFSARYASSKSNQDEDNNLLLLKNLQGVKNRQAHFACSIVFYYDDGKFVDGYGETKGEILQEKEGTGGFGYDPLFFSYELNKSFGLASATEKNAVSHRKRALTDLIEKVEALDLKLMNLQRIKK